MRITCLDKKCSFSVKGESSSQNVTSMSSDGQETGLNYEDELVPVSMLSYVSIKGV